MKRTPTLDGIFQAIQMSTTHRQYRRKVTKRTVSVLHARTTRPLSRRRPRRSKHARARLGMTRVLGAMRITHPGRRARATRSTRARMRARTLGLTSPSPMGAENSSSVHAFVSHARARRASSSTRERIRRASSRRRVCPHARRRRRASRARRVRVEHRRKRGCRPAIGVIHPRRRARDGPTTRSVFVRRMRARRRGRGTRLRARDRGRHRADLSKV